jgi:hypothetical protein
MQEDSWVIKEDLPGCKRIPGRSKMTPKGDKRIPEECKVTPWGCKRTP